MKRRVSAILLIAAVFMCGSPVNADERTARACPDIILDVVMGEPVPLETMIEDMAGVRIVYLGEVHTISRHHAFQETVLGKLADMGLELALGLEIFGAHQQETLDAWQASGEVFAHLPKYLKGEAWTNLEDYKGLLLAARDRNIPMVGLNARDALVRKIARKGLDGLADEERKSLPSGIEKINPQYDRLLRLKLMVHKAFERGKLDSIVLAQAVRDATMVRSIARFLESPRGKDRVMIVVAGAGHVNYGFGIPERAHRRTGLLYRIALPTESGELVLSEADKRHAAPVAVTHEDLRFIRAPIADYLSIRPRRERKPQPAPEIEEPSIAGIGDTLGRGAAK